MCGMNQQLFCTTKMLFDLSRAQQMLGQQVAAVEKTVADIQAQMQPKEQGEAMSIPFAE